MSWMILISAGAAVFLVRDTLLLAKATRRSLALYAFGATAVFAALGFAAESVSRDHALAWLRDARVWIPAVAIHALYWPGTFLARRGRWLPPWVLLVLPSPMYLFSAGGLAWLALQRVSGVDGWVAGALTGFAWSAAVLILRRLAAQVSCNEMEFSATANLTAILLIPLQQHSGQATAPGPPADWVASLLALAAVVSLVGLSYAVHRYRSSRNAAHS